MSIKIVLNGYFRSGTTFLGSYLKECFKHYKYMYEPLHRNLPYEVRKEAQNKAKNVLHDKFLYTDYQTLDESLLLKLYINRSNWEGIGTTSHPFLLKEYLKVFDSCPSDFTLKINRGSFFLDMINESFHPKIIHVIRHPLDVLASIENAYFRDNISLPKSIIRRIFKPFVFHKAFGIKDDFNWISRHFGVPVDQQNSWRKKYLERTDYFGKFVVVWTLSNYWALKQLKGFNGLLLPYEFVLTNPEKAKNQIGKYLGPLSEKAAFGVLNVNRGNYRKHSIKQLQKFVNCAKENDLEDEVKYIGQTLKSFDISYFA